MQQVFINLINNSLDAMPDGGVLSVKTSHEGEKVAIELSDTGEGIPSEILSRIFDPLFSTKDGRGSGLGLTIVKQVIDEHNGTVSIENGADSGAVFRITLPCRLRIHNSGISGLYSTAGRNAPESPVAPESAGISESAPGSPTK
jgi:signal transduction histidine kinase